jgi:hypothetical protein
MSHTLMPLAVFLMASLATIATAAELPDPFLFADGSRRVTWPQDWPRRREELLKLVLATEYGHLPPWPKEMQIVTILSHRSKLADARHRQFKLICDPGDAGREKISLIVDVMIPAKGDGPFPVILTGDWGWRKTPDEIALKILQRGYMLAEFNRTELAADLGPKKTEQVEGLRKACPDGDFGSIAAWAWGFMRCVDLLSGMPDVDKEKIAVTGHSRGGKAALLAGALDTRIALTAPNNSGCGGAGCFRFEGPQSETIENIVQSFPFWFTPRFADFAGKEDQLPFDQHEVKALVAPRALLTTEALGDLHANPSGTLQTHRAAREVYKFLGYPERIAIHFRPGGHEQNADDFATLLDFADEVFFDKGSHDWNPNPFPDQKPAFSWAAPTP